jgi:hypothetical protein
MAISLTDIRCGCGGLCDSGEPCPMRGNVQACSCDVQPVHSTEQHNFTSARYGRSSDDNQ